MPLIIACDLKPPLEPPKPKPKPPPSTPEVRTLSDAARIDTGAVADGSDLISDVRYSPEKPTAFDDIKVEVDLIPTGGKRIDVDYTWEVNGRKRISERSDTLPHRYFGKGDEVQVTLTIDGGPQLAEVKGPTVIVANTPPRILTKPNTLTRLDGFRIRAEDPDGARVKYSVKGAPPGLTVGETTGVFTYRPASDAEGGDYEIRSIVTDEDGAESEWVLGINIRGGSKSNSEIKRRKELAAKAKAEAEAEAETKNKASRPDR